MTAPCHFVTFGGGPGWREAADRLVAQALQTGLFKSVHHFTDQDLVARLPAIAPHWPFIESNPRGFGYWIWKPLVIGATMDQADAGDVVCYLDAGFDLLPDGEPELRKMIDFAHQNGAMILDYAKYPIFNAIFWTKADLWELPEFSGLLPDTRVKVPQASAGSVFLRATPSNRQIVATWFALATAEGYRFVDDTPSRQEHRTLFCEHRHDQPILSLLKATYQLPSYGSALDYDFAKLVYLRAWPSLLRRPFIAFHNRSGSSMIDTLKTCDPSLRGALWIRGKTVVDQLRYGLPPRPMGETERIARAMTRQHRAELERLGLLEKAVISFPLPRDRSWEYYNGRPGRIEPARQLGIRSAWMLGKATARNGAGIMFSTWREKAAQLRRLWRLPGATEAMHRATVEQFQATHRATVEQFQGPHRVTVEQFHAMHRATGEQFDAVLRMVPQRLEPLTHASLGLHRARLQDRYGAIDIVTDHPVAVESPDHLVPWGTANDNSRNQRFNARLIALVPHDRLSILDLGCSGGGQVRSFIEQGYLAVGVEGSDYSARRLRAEWSTIPDYLFTADITKPFHIRTSRGSGALQFGVVTMWEVIEHIAEKDLSAVLSNIDAHLCPGGITIMSVSPNTEVIRGTPLHQTVQQRPWWESFFQANGWKNHSAIVDYFGENFVREESNAPGSFHFALSRTAERPLLTQRLQHLAPQ